LRGNSPRVFISCDRELPYEELMSVVDIITRAGATEISISELASGGTSP
jgi:biopolymer transport protein ExbD